MAIKISRVDQPLILFSGVDHGKLFGRIIFPDLGGEVVKLTTNPFQLSSFSSEVKWGQVATT